MSRAVTDREATEFRSLPWILAHGVLNTFFVLWTFGGSVFLLFLSELGLPKAQIGAALSMFPFCGLVALWFAPVAARAGRKQVFLWGYGLRKVVMAGLLLLPWLFQDGGRTVAIAWTFLVIGGFALCRALAETAWYPWYQEFVPNEQRGLVGALLNVLGLVAAAVALSVAGWVIQQGQGLPRFLVLIAVGCLLGIGGVLVLVGLPGGAPLAAAEAGQPHRENLKQALRDGNFRSYLAGLGWVTVATALLFSFLPLFVHEALGVPAAQVVLLDLAVMAGGAASSLACAGWADRVGSRPLLLPAVLANALVPLGWLLCPRSAAHPLVWCGALYFAHGAASSAVLITSQRLLFNGVVPPSRNTSYTAIYYAWLGLAGGAAPLLAGALLNTVGGREAHLGGHRLDGYAVLFALSLVAFGVGGLCWQKVRPDDRYTTRQLLQVIAERVYRRFSLQPWR